MRGSPSFIDLNQPITSGEGEAFIYWSSSINYDVLLQHQLAGKPRGGLQQVRGGILIFNLNHKL